MLPTDAKACFSQPITQLWSASSAHRVSAKPFMPSMSPKQTIVRLQYPVLRATHCHQTAQSAEIMCSAIKKRASQIFGKYLPAVKLLFPLLRALMDPHNC